MRSVSREGLDGGRDAAPNYIRLPALTSIFSVELPGIQLELLPGSLGSELQLRYVSVRFSLARYLRFRSRVLTASRMVIRI